MRPALLIVILLSMFAPLSISAQEGKSIVDRITDFPNKLFGKVGEKTKQLDDQLEKQTEKYLNKLARKEDRLKRKLYKQDSAKAAALFANDPQQQYASLLQKLKTDTSRVLHSMGPEYLPYADSLNGALSFLNKNPQLLGSSKLLPADIQRPLSELQQLQSRLQNADMIKQFIQQRRDKIRQYLSGEASMPPGASGLFNSYNKELYYYSAQVRKYREMLNDPDKMLKTALAMLNKLPVFTDFMKSNSFLAGLFSVAANYGSPEAMDGLQSRDQVLAMIQNQIGSSGANPSSALQGGLQAAQQDINSLHDKLSKLGGGSGDMEIPGFKPNTQKTKTFLERLEYETNIQTQHAAYYFPTTTHLALSVGYKLSQKNTVGIGASYKIGWGNGIQHINISGQGAGLRSFVDIQAKKSFYLSGGYEYNYQPIPASQTGVPLIGEAWQQSGLVGISKVVSMNTKVFKSTKLQFLWDFLSYYQIPKGQPIKFRVGYSF